MTSDEYENRIRGFHWDGLRELYNQVRERKTLGWEPGKAFEYLIVRAFELDGARVRYPYRVKLEEEVVQEIDGAVALDGLHCLIECKDEMRPINVEPLAKLSNQLHRRPSATVGMIFSTSGYTDPALLLARYMTNQAILLWHPGEIDLVMKAGAIAPTLHEKYRYFVAYGQSNTYTPTLEQP